MAPAAAIFRTAQAVAETIATWWGLFRPVIVRSKVTCSPTHYRPRICYNYIKKMRGVSAALVGLYLLAVVGVRSSSPGKPPSTAAKEAPKLGKCRLPDYLYLAERIYLLPVLSAGSYNVTADQISVSGISSGGFMAVQFHVAFSKTIMGSGITAGGAPSVCAASSSAVPAPLTATSLLLSHLIFSFSSSSLSPPFPLPPSSHSSFFLLHAGPFFCAQDNLLTALSACMKQPQDISVEKLVDITYAAAATATIDPPEEMKGDGVFLISGTNDSIVVPGEEAGRSRGGVGFTLSPSFIPLSSSSLHSFSLSGVMKKLEAYYSCFGTRIQTEFSIPAEHSQV